MFIINANEGEQIAIGDRLITVLPMPSPGVVNIMVDGEDLPVPIGWDRKVELFPSVHVSIEKNLGFSQRIKFLFDAPRSVLIREVRDETPTSDNSKSECGEAGQGLRPPG